MNLFTRNSPYYHHLKDLLFLFKHSVDDTLSVLNNLIHFCSRTLLPFNLATNSLPQIIFSTTENLSPLCTSPQAPGRYLQHPLLYQLVGQRKGFTLRSFLWLCSPARAMASSFSRFRDHTQRRATVGRTPLDEWSARRRDLYLTIYTTNTHAPCGIRTHDCSMRAAVDPCLRPRDHWDRLLLFVCWSF
jgi:choline dehydrogenase-like flavoprotein